MHRTYKRGYRVRARRRVAASRVRRRLHRVRSHLIEDSREGNLARSGTVPENSIGYRQRTSSPICSMSGSKKNAPRIARTSKRRECSRSMNLYTGARLINKTESSESIYAIYRSRAMNSTLSSSTFATLHASKNTNFTYRDLPSVSYENLEIQGLHG